MHLLRLDQVDTLRARAHDAAPEDRDTTAAELADLAGGDVRALQVAWSTFVPFLAHPAMAKPADASMTVLDGAGMLLARDRAPA